MTTLSFYARGDGSSANNAALNVENQTQQPTVMLTFDSGATGDIVLEYNGGATDPDTTVIINGVRFAFEVELTGVLPLRNGKVPDPLEGKQVTVISVVINGQTERFFFVTDGSGTLALMNQFGSGAIGLTSANFAPPPVYICFCSGTKILTPTGYRKVETLRIGDLVITDEGQQKPIVWVGSSVTSIAEMFQYPERQPIRIAANSIEPGVPSHDLDVSAQHRVVLKSNAVELLFGEPQVLVPAKHMIGTIARQLMPKQAVTYNHILLDEHDAVLSNGLATESLQLSNRSFDGLSPSAQASLSETLSLTELHRYLSRTDKFRSLTKHESMVLVEAMFGAQASRGFAHSPRQKIARAV